MHTYIFTYIHLQIQIYLQMFNKYLSDVTIASQIKPTRQIYALYNLQEHSSVSQFLMLFLKVDKDVSSFQPLGKILEILALKEVIVSAPYLTEFTLLLLTYFALEKLHVRFLTLKTSSMITGFKTFFVLKILVASICRFFDV